MKLLMMHWHHSEEIKQVAALWEAGYYFVENLLLPI